MKKILTHRATKGAGAALGFVALVWLVVSVVVYLTA